MAADHRTAKASSKRKPAARTPEAREAQLVSMAYEFAEEQFRSGEASSQVTTHFLKLGSERERLEREKIRHETVLLEAKVKQIESQLQSEAEGFARCSATGDFVEGITAFLEKRKPSFRGE